MSFRTLQDELKNEGYQAGLAGKPIDSNRPIRESQRAAWEIGWRAGKKEFDQGKREPAPFGRNERARYAIELRPCKCLHTTAVITVVGGAATARCFGCGEPIKLRKEAKH